MANGLAASCQLFYRKIYGIFLKCAGTDETVPLLHAARARIDTEPPNITGEEKAHGPTGTRTQDLSHTVQAL